MALINCHECGNKVSTSASSCPKCGAPIELEKDFKATGTHVTTIQKTSKRFKLHQIFATLLLIIGIFSIIGKEHDKTIPIIITIIALVWLFITKFRIWWYHK